MKFQFEDIIVSYILAKAIKVLFRIVILHCCKTSKVSVKPKPQDNNLRSVTKSSKDSSGRCFRLSNNTADIIGFFLDST